MTDFELLRPFMSEGRATRLQSVLSARTERLALVLENLYDPHNLSAILRTADAFGLQRVILAGKAPRDLNPLVALGAERWLTVTREPAPERCLAALRAEGYCVAAAALVENAVDPARWEPGGPLALVLGNEHDGLSAVFLEGADAVLRLPLCGFARSLNVSVAAGVLVRELLQKRATAERGLRPARAAELLDLWARRSVENSAAILDRLRGRGAQKMRPPFSQRRRDKKLAE